MAQGATLTTATISAALNGLSKSAVLTVNRVLPVGNAVFDTTLKAPRCNTVDSFCDSGGLIDGRASLGPETQHAQHDQRVLRRRYVRDLSRRRVARPARRSRPLDGTPLAAGKTVKIEATVWVWGATSDFLELYFAPDATNAGLDRHRAPP